jgi:hypothetical protein
MSVTVTTAVNLPPLQTVCMVERTCQAPKNTTRQLAGGSAPLGDNESLCQDTM